MYYAQAARITAAMATTATAANISPQTSPTKNLNLPTGTVPPARNFYFEINLVDVWNGSSVTPLPTITIPNVTIPFTHTTTSASETFNFNSINWRALGLSAGFYTFQVREYIPSGTNPAVGTNEIMVYDENVFYIFLQIGWICDDFDA